MKPIPCLGCRIDPVGSKTLTHPSCFGTKRDVRRQPRLSREGNNSPGTDHWLTCQNFQVDISCYAEEKIEMSAQFMPKGSNKTGGTPDTFCPYDIAKLHELIRNRSDLSKAEKWICLLQSEHFGTMGFRSKDKNVVDCIALLSLEEQVSPSKKELKG